MPDICMQHMCAVMLLDGIGHFRVRARRARMRDPKVLALRKRIELMADDEFESRRPQRHGIVELTLADGRRAQRTHGRRARHRAESDDARRSGREGLRPDGADSRQAARARALRRGMEHRAHQGSAQAASFAAGLTLDRPRSMVWIEAAVAAACLAAAGGACAQSFPYKPIRMVTELAAGTGGDVFLPAFSACRSSRAVPRNLERRTSCVSRRPAGQ